MSNLPKTAYTQIAHIRRCAKVVHATDVRISINLLDNVFRELSALEEIRATASTHAHEITNLDRPSDRWLDLPDASVVLGISERTIRRRVRAGAISSRMRRGRRQVLVRPVSNSALIGGDA